MARGRPPAAGKGACFDVARRAAAAGSRPGAAVRDASTACRASSTRWAAQRLFLRQIVGHAAQRLRVVGQPLAVDGGLPSSASSSRQAAPYRCTHRDDQRGAARSRSVSTAARTTPAPGGCARARPARAAAVGERLGHLARRHHAACVSRAPRRPRAAGHRRRLEPALRALATAWLTVPGFRCSWARRRSGSARLAAAPRPGERAATA